MKNFGKFNLSRNLAFQKEGIVFLLLVGAPFFFIGGPGRNGARSILALWDLGHVLFFFLTSLSLCGLIRNHFPHLSTALRWIIIFFVTLFAGIGIEYLQMGVDGRYSDYHDLLRNQLGCLLTFAFVDSASFRIWKGWQLLFKLTVLSLLFLALFPLFRAVTDEMIARCQFPVLSDFETMLEGERWKDQELLSIEKGVARHGKNSLKVQLTTDTYSGVSLTYFPGNWVGFKSMHISLFCPDGRPMDITCRIHDKNHKNKYTDRYNGKLMLKYGWNDFIIPLADVEHAPKGRLLDMKQIVNVQFFVTREEEKRILYIDNLYLEK